MAKICFVSIDVESDFAKEKTFDGVESIGYILRVFKKHNINSTLFVTGRVLERYSSKFKEISKSYEIGCHSFSHKYWDHLDNKARSLELDKFIDLYSKAIGGSLRGFRAPSHVIDQEGINLLQNKGFLYDSSVLPHLVPFKKYRGYKGKAPLNPYFPNSQNYKEKGNMDLLEIPVTGLSIGFPLAGTWLRKLPFFVYRFLLLFNNPSFITFNLHSWDSLNDRLLGKIDKSLEILIKKGYKFLSGIQIYESVSKNTK